MVGKARVLYHSPQIPQRGFFLSVVFFQRKHSLRLLHLFLALSIFKPMGGTLIVSMIRSISVGYSLTACLFLSGLNAFGAELVSNDPSHETLRMFSASADFQHATGKPGSRGWE